MRDRRDKTGGERAEQRTEAERNTHTRVRACLTFVCELHLLGRRVHAALAPLWCQGGFQQLGLTPTQEICAGGEIGKRYGGLGSLRSHRSFPVSLNCRGSRKALQEPQTRMNGMVMRYRDARTRKQLSVSSAGHFRWNLIMGIRAPGF